MRGRLKFTSDALDFFREDTPDMSQSKRVRGVVLHDILSRVVVPEDLEQSVMYSFHQGEITEDEAVQVRELLTGALEDGVRKGWFPADRNKVMNEVTLIDVGGAQYRPDRVILDGDKVMIVDYKFGEAHDRYRRQVNKYAELWKNMGYTQISGFLWYVETGEIVEVL